jgi:very-short-patch-repair endonuclease
MSNPKARQLRQQSTDAERRMWSALRHRRLMRYRFRRQHPLGDFIVDFACTEFHLAIEVYGGQHSDNAVDTSRTAWLQSQGWKILRFWNNDVLSNTNGVIETILRALEDN